MSLRQTFRRFIVLAVIAAGIALEASIGEAQTLVIGVRQFPTNLHPLIESTSAKWYTLSAVRRPLTAYDQNWQLVCLFCEQLPTLENGSAERRVFFGGGEGVQVSFTLPAGATWGDGTPLTTRDVLFTWNVGRHPESGAAKSSFFRSIKSIDLLDERRFIIVFEKLSFNYNDLGDFRLLPAHIEESIFRQAPAAYRNQSAFVTQPTNPGLYFGPYLITGIVQGSQITLSRNPHWRGVRPAFDRVVVRTIPNTSALIANLRSGDIDMIAGEIGISVEEAVELERDQPGRYQFIYKPGLLFEHIDLNLGNPILADRRVRQALLFGVDRETLISSLFSNRQTIAHSSVSPLDRTYSGEVPQYGYDPVRANALLDAAGWQEIKDGVRHDSQGRPLSIEINSTAGHRAREQVQQILKDQWGQLGVELRIRNSTPRIFFGDTLLKRKFSGMALYAYSTSPEWVPRAVFHSSQIPSAGNNWAGYNLTGIDNPRLDKLIENIETTLDFKGRKRYWAGLQDLIANELPVLPLYFQSLPHVLPRWLSGVEPTGHEAPSTLWIENWRDTRAGK